MIQRYIIALLLSLPVTAIQAQPVGLGYYLPDIEYREDVTAPEAFFGFQPGEWHVSHSRLVDYMYTLASQSGRVQVQEYAQSHEQRPLVVVTITSEDNQQRIDDILQQRRDICYPSRSVTHDRSNYPIVIYQGYSVHGDEASGANAAALVAYYLAAGKSAEISALLHEVVVLLDPCLNPDGYNRFSSWVNAHRGNSGSTDPNDREFHEAWPGGRTNHYWFDLNRDWLPAVHPESQGRLALFHKWKPVLLTDHHEMGSERTFFFMPGIPSRVNPVTPRENQALTAEIAQYHARTLDEMDVLYYTRESFDDFYAGKGSTYPDLNGCVGILFEQAGVEGHAVETQNGLLTFPFAIRNQVATSLSTQKAATAMKEQLADFQCAFFASARQEATEDPVKAYVFGEPTDEARLFAFVDILLQHDITVHYLAKGKKAGNFMGDGRHHFVVPTAQPQYRMIRSLFERPTEFEDSLFYDVSAWTLPLAFDIPHSTYTGRDYQRLLGVQVYALPALSGTIHGGMAGYAYIIPWTGHLAPKVLYALLDQNIAVRVAERPFFLQVDESVLQFDAGSLVVPVQGLNAEWLHDALTYALANTGITAFAAHSGYTPQGPDLGSGMFHPVNKPDIALLVGDGVNRYDAGELWHLFDDTYRIPLTKLDLGRIGRADLQRYSVVLMPDGNYRLDDREMDVLRSWVDQGGILIAARGGMSWVAGAGLLRTQPRPVASVYQNGPRPYEGATEDRRSTYLGGAIVQVSLDLTHPLAFGYDRDVLSVFRRGTAFYEPADNAYASPLRYTKSPLLAGYVHDQQIEVMRESAAVIVGALGSGRVIGFADNHTFRGFWWGTQKLIANAVFFGEIISAETAEYAPALHEHNK